MVLISGGEGFAVGGNSGMIEVVELFCFLFDGLLGTLDYVIQLCLGGCEEGEVAASFSRLISGFEVEAAGLTAELFLNAVAVDAWEEV